jgi:hypothetical protein
MRVYILLGTICLACMAVGTVAEAAQTVPFQEADSAASDPNQIVCHETGAPTGSRIGPARECHTAKEWEARREEHQRALVSQQNHALMGAPR